MRDLDKFLAIHQGLMNHHSRDGLVIFLLFGRVSVMRF